MTPADRGDCPTAAPTEKRKRGNRLPETRNVEAKHGQMQHKYKKVLKGNLQQRENEEGEGEGQKLLEQGLKQATKDGANGAAPSKCRQVAGERRPTTVSDGGERAGQIKPPASPSSRTSIPPWLEQLTSLEVSGVSGTNLARAALVIREVRPAGVAEPRGCLLARAVYRVLPWRLPRTYV